MRRKFHYGMKSRTESKDCFFCHYGVFRNYISENRIYGHLVRGQVCGILIILGSCMNMYSRTDLT